MSVIDEKFNKWFDQEYPDHHFDVDKVKFRELFKSDMKLAFIEGLKIGFSASFDSHLNKDISTALT